jgi:hypothetical protein
MARTFGRTFVALGVISLPLAYGTPAPAADTDPVLAPRPGGTSSSAAIAAQAPAAPRTDEEVERFLKAARIVKTKGTKKGITGSTQATMSDGIVTHDAHIQTIDEYKAEFQSPAGVELGFRDSWSFNVAGYRLDRLIGLDMVPVSVAGRYRGTAAAITWWIDEVIGDDGDRLKKKIEPPVAARWNQQRHLMWLFDELIANVDRNVGNIVYSKDWRLWLIDHTRAFRKTTELKQPARITRCDRQVFERLKALDRDTLKRELGKYLDDGQIKALLSRRDLIVQRVESLGPSALFDREPAVALGR